MKQLKYVLVLADEGSFSRAAEILDISQPSLSQYVKKIEQQLGVVLFDRANGNVRLTDAGKIYIEASRKILELERQMQSKFDDLSEHKSGSIIIGTTPFRSVTMMPIIASKFKCRYPGIHIIVDERGNHELPEAAERGSFDLCVITLPIDDRKFKSEFIMEEEVVIAVSRGGCLDKKLSREAIHMENRKYNAVDAKLLDGESFVMLTESQVMQKALDNLCKDYELHLTKAAVVKSIEAQIEMVRAGVGAALVPTGIQKFDGLDCKISYFSLKQELPRRKVVVMYRKNQHLSIVMQDLIKTMKLIEW